MYELGNRLRKRFDSQVIYFFGHACSKNAPIELIFGVYQVFLLIQRSASNNLDIAHYIIDFSAIFPQDQLISLPPSLEFGQGKNTTFYFTESFRCFQLNKSVLETKETKQADSQLFFAPKNFKIYLLVLENELFDVAYVVSKKFKKQKHIHCTYMAVCIR